MEAISVRVSVPLNPTEDQEKVRRALLNIVDAPEVEEVELGNSRRLLIAQTGQKGLERLRNLLAAERVRDAARRVFKRSLRGETLVVHLNKQAAFVGRVSFCEEHGESPLGAIRLEIRAQDPRAFIDWIAPSSRRA